MSPRLRRGSMPDSRSLHIEEAELRQLAHFFHSHSDSTAHNCGRNWLLHFPHQNEVRGLIRHFLISSNGDRTFEKYIYRFGQGFLLVHFLHSETMDPTNQTLKLEE